MARTGKSLDGPCNAIYTLVALVGQPQEGWLREDAPEDPAHPSPQPAGLHHLQGCTCHCPMKGGFFSL